MHPAVVLATDEILKAIEMELSKGRHWATFRTFMYHVDVERGLPVVKPVQHWRDLGKSMKEEGLLQEVQKGLLEYLVTVRKLSEVRYRNMRQLLCELDLCWAGLRG
jgi:hypothetical protein